MTKKYCTWSRLCTLYFFMRLFYPKKGEREKEKEGKKRLLSLFHFPCTLSSTAIPNQLSIRPLHIRSQLTLPLSLSSSSSCLYYFLHDPRYTFSFSFSSSLSPSLLSTFFIIVSLFYSLRSSFLSYFLSLSFYFSSFSFSSSSPWPCTLYSTVLSPFEPI